METVNNSNIQNMSSLRIELHKQGFYNVNVLDRLAYHLGTFIEALNVNIDYQNLQIDIKIKKTAMKKNILFSHNVLFYYPLIDTALAMLFAEHTHSLLHITHSIPCGQFPTTFLNSETIRLLYNVTCISDNIVIIKL